MEIVQLQGKNKPPQNLGLSNSGGEMVMAKDPSQPGQPMGVPSSQVSLPPKKSNPLPPETTSDKRQEGGTEEAVSPLGEPLPEAPRDAKVEAALRNLVNSIETMFQSPKFKQILVTARDNGVYMTKEDPTIGEQLKAAKKLLE